MGRIKKKKGSLSNDLYYAYDNVEELKKAKNAQPKIKKVVKIVQHKGLN